MFLLLLKIIYNVLFQDCHQLPCCIFFNFSSNFKFGKSQMTQGSKLGLLCGWQIWMIWCFAKSIYRRCENLFNHCECKSHGTQAHLMASHCWLILWGSMFTHVQYWLPRYIKDTQPQCLNIFCFMSHLFVNWVVCTLCFDFSKIWKGNYF